MHASNAARFKQSYRDIANYIKVPRRQDPKADIFQLVHDWLHDKRKGKWFIILDNVDDASFLLKAQSTDHDQERSSVEGKSRQPLISYVPQRKHGSVLVTTRSKNAARGLVSERDIVTVDPMEMGDALSLSRKKLGEQETNENVANLAAELECMPLAMAQAAAYIVQQRPCCSVQQYLANFRRSGRKKAALFNNKDIQVRDELRPQAMHSLRIHSHFQRPHHFCTRYPLQRRRQLPRSRTWHT